MSGNILNVEDIIGNLDQITLRFTYRVPAIGSCPESVAAQASVTIFRAARSGIPSNLILCDTQVSAYTNLDLNDLLIGEDANGRWSDINNPSTMELTSPTDRIINVQNIGVGIFSFVYTVQPKSPICTPRNTVVRVIVEKLLDFTGATLVINEDICEDEISTAFYSAILTQGAQNIPDGVYDVTYEVSGPNRTVTNTVRASFNNGILNFTLGSALFNRVGTFTVRIISINNANSFSINLNGFPVCNNIINDLFDVLHVYPLPVLNAPLNIVPICQGQDAIVSFSVATNLPDGDYSITYNLTGNNTANDQTAVINATGGVLSGFTIPAGLIPNPGNTTITITTIRNLITNCSNVVTIAPYQFLINPIPVTTNLSVSVTGICQDEPVQVRLSGLNNLSSITVNYNLSGANTANNQTADLVVNSGNGSFIIPPSLITNTGPTTISIIFITNTITTCGSAANSTANFIINPIPAAPVANNAVFCEAENATVGNLLPNGIQYQWFNAANATLPLSNSTSLVTGNYYVKEINTLTGCTSPAAMVTVSINQVDRPTLNPLGQNFCGAENPTIQNLTNNTSSNNTVIWFDSATGGNQLPATTLLQDGVTYYAFGFSNITNCFSVNGLPVTVSLTNCDVVPNFFIPDGFSPNGDGVNDTFTIPDIEFIYPDYSLEIYNRYGNLMFKGNKNKPDWDGNNSQSNLIDAMAPNGVYFYVLYYNKGTIPPKQGRLYLNR
ncbi:MAG TPA: gliding motility-associated C-terminal domain-containing protein [Flavobacterium sp.]